MCCFRKIFSKKLPSPTAKKPRARLRLEFLEDRRCPTAVVFAGFVPNTAVLNITEVFSANSPANGPGSSLTISGNTAAGTGGPTSMVTITGGFETTINGMNAVTFTTLFPGAITAINVTVLNDNETITVGTPTGIINLPGTTLNVTVGSGNDTLIMGTAGTPGGLGTGGVSEVNNVLNAVNFKAANINSTGNEEVDILDAMVASVNIQENSGGGDKIRLWGVTANGQVNLAQNNGASDIISIDQLQSTNPGPNLVQNPGFETGDFTGWTVNSQFSGVDTEPALAHSGNDSAFFGQQGSLGTLSQALPLATTPGTTYSFSFWYASDGGTPNELSATIGGTTVFDQTDIPSTFIPANASQHGYVQFTTTFTATSTSTPLVFGVRDDPGFIFLDDVSVIPLNVTTISSVMGVVKTTQGNGRVDNTTINRTQIRVSLSSTQGNGNSDGIFLGQGDTVGSPVTPPGGTGTGIFNGPVLLAQGTGSDDYVGVANLKAGIVSILQQDLSSNASGDQVGGVRTNVIPPSTLFGDPGLDAPTTTTVSMPNGVGGREEIVQTASPPFANDLGVAAPTDGFRNALLEQLNITQGNAAGDIIALVQLAPGVNGGGSLNEILSVPGAPFIPGVGSVPGTITLLQQDLPGASSDFIFMGSYNFGPSAPNPPTGVGPFPWNHPAATGSITATNYLVAQGNASGDILSVLFTTATSPTTALSSLFLQGNGGNDAFFQMDTAVTGGLFNFSDGSGGNYVQADSNNVIGTFDGGANVPLNILGQDNNNMAVLFVDFGNVIFA
jgi:hypothetical protein